MRPSALEIVTRDFALAAGHCRVAISRLAGTLRSKSTPVAAAVFLGGLGRRLLAGRGRDARHYSEPRMAAVMAEWECALNTELSVVFSLGLQLHSLQSPNRRSPGQCMGPSEHREALD